jgi:putative OmpL-like beta-barrel porin-2
MRHRSAHHETRAGPRTFRACLALVLAAGGGPVYADELPPAPTDWHYGGFVDLGYALDFNFPENHRWRSKGTTPRVNELAPNLALAYLRKDASASSRWGLEVGLQGGYDTNALVPQPTPGRDQPIGGADTLRHVSRANLSYLAPVGNGLTLTAGLFNSYIGYQSIYAKDNLNYTRTYMADNAPYFMFGLAARYPVSDRLTLSAFAINGYTYLSHPNDRPSYGTQAAWKPADRWTVTQNLYYGPDQAGTDLRFWRLFSDSIVEWKHQSLTLAAAYDIGTEEAAEQAGHPRTFWMGGAVYAHWNVSGPWSLAVRPEFYWDRNGRITGSEQFIKAITTTAEYRLRAGMQSLIARLEHRYDESRGRDGGFFKGGELAPGVIGLAPEQHLLLLSLIWAFDS